MEDKPRILLTGVTGYVGGRLKTQLEELGFPLRCLVRSNIGISQAYLATTQYVFGNADDKKILLKALEGIDVAFYLIQSLGAVKDYSIIDRMLAVNFAQAASKCKVKKIIYLGGLGANYDEQLSKYLRSRHEVGSVLRAHAAGVQVLELRASVIFGSGSLSFEMIKSLVENLPIMVTPKWLRTELQPIGISDVLNYLIKAVDIAIEGDLILEIGGKERVSYEDCLRIYASLRGLKRLIIPAPCWMPYLSSLWLGLVTPLYARVAGTLIASAQCSTIVHDPLARRLFHFETLSVKESLALAMQNENHSFASTRWNDAVSSALTPKDWSNVCLGKRLEDYRESIVPAALEEAFAPLLRLGGQEGYPFINILFWLRGFIDLMLGGVGMRRGRKNHASLAVGDVIDCWRVEAYQHSHYIKLADETKIPGKAWLEFQVDSHAKGIKISQRVIFDPAGATGVLYWYIMYPIHKLMFWALFKGLIKQIKEKS
jgi:uncharacterized protein YbjT (DUF2867 family)